MHEADIGNRRDRPAPHELANELTRDRSVEATSRTPETRPPPFDRQRDMVPPVERQVGRSMLLVILAAAAIGLIVASILLHSVVMVLIAAVFIVPFMLLVSAPVWMASVTKVAQDETVREQRRETA